MSPVIEGKALSRAVVALEVTRHLPIILQWRKMWGTGSLLELCSIRPCSNWRGHWFLYSLAAFYGILVSQTLEYLSFGLFHLDFSSVHMPKFCVDLFVGEQPVPAHHIPARKQEKHSVSFYNLVCRLTRQKSNTQRSSFCGTQGENGMLGVNSRVSSCTSCWQ